MRKFKVFDNLTKEEAGAEEIAQHEDWAKNLMWMDMEGFAIEEDGTLLLLDECGHFEYCPVGRFTVEVIEW